MSVKRGFAAMKPETQRKIASAGGKQAHANGTAHEFTSEEAQKAGKVGGAKLAKERGSEYFADLGRKGGLSVSKDREHMRNLGRLGGTKVAANREHMRRLGVLGAKKRLENRAG